MNSGSDSVLFMKIPKVLCCVGVSLVVLTSVTEAQNIVPAGGLVSWWRGDGNALDSADNNNGVALNGASYAPGAFGNAFAFDGLNDHVRVPTAANLNITGPITLGAWVNRRTTGTFDEIISKWDAIPVGQRCYTLGINPDGRAFVGLSTGGLDVPGVSLTGPAVLPLNTWVHVAATYDGSSAKVFVNGVLANQTAYSGGIFSSANDLAIGGVVGGLGSGSGISFFDGRIDDAVIYNRALTETEVLALATIPEPSSLGLMAAAIVVLSLKRNRRAGARPV